MEIKEKLQRVNQDETLEDFAELLEAHELSPAVFHPGMRVTGTIIDISGDNVFLDIGLKVDGIMDKKDISDASGQLLYGQGDTLEAWVTSMSAHEIRLARSMGGSGLAALEEARDAQIPVEGKITGICKGGYLVEVLGKRAFCPGSQLDGVTQDEAEAQIGRTLKFLVTRIEDRGRNIVVSQRALKELERQENLEKVLSELEVGAVVEGIIARFAPFGAFMEVAPGVEGLIHISELGWGRVEQPQDAVILGEKVHAKVLGIEKNDKGQLRISLSRRKAEPDPWTELGDRLKPGEIVRGRVVRLAPFGAFVELFPGVEGLVHLSELSWEKRINKAEDVVKPGDNVEVKIKDINPDGRRISLSLKEAEADPWAGLEDRLAPGEKCGGVIESNTRHGLFISLAPGITGLVPAAYSKKSTALFQLPEGSPVEVAVHSIDTAARRISLMPAELAATEERHENSWREYAPKSGSTGNMGLMAQALQKAFEKTRG